MLQKLEKEIDDVDAKIGDQWRILDRYLPILFFILCLLLHVFTLLVFLY